MSSICVSCKHHRWSERPNLAAPNVWYNHLCGKSPLPPKVDYTTGITEEGYADCREINPHGECANFEMKESEP